MKKFWVKLLSRNGEISSKRFVTLVALLMLCIGFIADLFWDFKVDEVIYNSMETIVEIGMGTIVAEKFGKNHPEMQIPDETKEEDGDNETKNDV